MSTKKKTNYIGYELEWLEERCQELREWVEVKLRGGIKDRIEIFTQGRTPVIKVISSEETQIKTLRDTLKELPSMLMEINRLRKLAEEEEADGRSVRGDHDIPGFMDDDEDDHEDEDDDIPPPPKQKSKKQEKEDSPNTSPKKLLPPSKKEEPGFADEEDETDDFDLDDGDFEDP
jgi:hypothetical protein